MILFGWESCSSPRLVVCPTTWASERTLALGSRRARQNMVLWAGSKSRPGNRTAAQKMTATLRPRDGAAAWSAKLKPWLSVNSLIRSIPTPVALPGARLASSAAPLVSAVRTSHLPCRQAPFFKDPRFVALLQCSMVFLFGREKPPRNPENRFVHCGKRQGGGGVTMNLCPNETLDGTKRGCQRTPAAILTLR